MTTYRILQKLKKLRLMNKTITDKNIGRLSGKIQSFCLKGMKKVYKEEKLLTHDNNDSCDL